MTRFSRFAWGVTAYNILVILWGAWVRISGSGAGCGEHWPDCNGEVIPTAPTTRTLIEFTHRATSGLCLVLTLAMAVWAYRVFAPRHHVRRAANVTLAFVLAEAALGASAWAPNTTRSRAPSSSVCIWSTRLGWSARAPSPPIGPPAARSRAEATRAATCLAWRSSPFCWSA